MYRVTIILFATIISTSFAQEVFDGSCPSVRVEQPFAAARFQGKWYEWGRFLSETELGTKCNEIGYLFDDANVQIIYSALDSKNEINFLRGSASLPGQLGQFNISIPELGISNFNYFILATDYTNWTASFACRDLGGNQHQRYVWILTRTPSPTAEAIASAKRAVTDQGISIASLQQVDQQQCQ